MRYNLVIRHKNKVRELDLFKLGIKTNNMTIKQLEAFDKFSYSFNNEHDLMMFLLSNAFISSEEMNGSLDISKDDDSKEYLKIHYKNDDNLYKIEKYPLDKAVIKCFEDKDISFEYSYLFAYYVQNINNKLLMKKFLNYFYYLRNVKVFNDDLRILLYYNNDLPKTNDDLNNAIYALERFINNLAFNNNDRTKKSYGGIRKLAMFRINYEKYRLVKFQSLELENKREESKKIILEARNIYQNYLNNSYVLNEQMSFDEDTLGGGGR